MLAQYFPPDVNGSSTRVYNAARGLLLQGCRVTVVTSFPHYPNGRIPPKYKNKILTREEIEGIIVVRTWIPKLSHSVIFQRVLSHISFVFLSLLGLRYVRKADVIFAMNPNLFVFFSAIMYKVLFRKNIIRNVDDLWPEVFYDLGIVKSAVAKRILDFLAKISYRIPAAIIPVSYGYVKTLLTKYRVPSEKIIVIEHGVDIEQFRAHKKDSDAASRGRKTVMYSGALNIGYDFETVIKAANLLRSERVSFIIRGAGELSDRLTRMVKEYGLTNVAIITELLPRAELVTFLNSADIFLLPMSHLGVIDQGLPTKILEYQALGKPIVCISTGEAANYIMRTQSGLVATRRQPEELARLIMQLVNDDELACRLGCNGSNNIRTNLTLEMVGKRLMEVINKITTPR